ncbi:MAG: hypothetical protein IJ601_10575 [Acidaminococcaceae bacterium]|nr:hypothetical protein [Acidaminococcaceae bacterium]MBR1495473.1 hypothetical protein [Acidaminococcaceae bacterium]
MTEKINFENNQLEDINISIPKVLLDRIVKHLEKGQTIQEFIQDAIQEKLEK